MISNIVNQAFKDMKLAALAGRIVSHSFKSVPDETIAESLEECTATGASSLLVPFRYPPLLCLFDSAASSQTHEFPEIPSAQSILQSPGYIELKKEMEKFGFYVTALLVGKNYAEMAIAKTPPSVPLEKQTEMKLG